MKKPKRKTAPRKQSAKRATSRRRRKAPPMFALGQRIYIKAREEVGSVSGRYESTYGSPGYFVTCRGGRLWFEQNDLAAI